MLEHGKIRIENVTGNIEITATKVRRIKGYIIKAGVLVNPDYDLYYSSLYQRDGYVEVNFSAGSSIAPRVSWHIENNEKNYSKLICKLSNPSWSGGSSAGGYIFAGNGQIYGRYIDGSYAYREIGGNGFGPFSTPLEFISDFNGNPETFYTGIQMYYRANDTWSRQFQIYELKFAE